ncbi:uncharacterized protein METZ01_LOCUS471745, partial [marine metagenome]
KHVSNKKAHFITLNPNKIKTQVRREMENRGDYGFNKLPPEMNEVINTEVPKMVAAFYSDFKNWNAPGTSKASVVTDLVGGPKTGFTFTIAAAEGKFGTDIFQAFRSRKQENQRSLVEGLNNAIKALNKGKSKRDKKPEVDSGVFMDIGNQEGSAVSEQRKEHAEQALFDFGTNYGDNAVVKKFLKEIEGKVTLSLVKKDGESIDKLSVVLESSALNRERGAKEEKELAEKLQKDLNKILSQIKKYD